MKKEKTIGISMYNLTSDVGWPSFEQVLEDAKIGKKSLILVSGGLDSAYMLWKYAQYTDDIVCHHISMYDSISQRADTERFSVERQIEYLRNQGKHIKLITSEVRSTYEMPLLRDWYTGVILSLNYAYIEGISHIVAGDCFIDAFDRNQNYSTLSKDIKEHMVCLGNFVRAYTRNRCDTITAFEANNLAEMYNEMPDDYKKLIFSCREPKYINKRIEACGNCHSCMKNRHFGWWNKISKCIYKDEIDGVAK